MKPLEKGEVLTCSNLLKLYKRNSIDKVAEKIQFQGVGKRDVYNITAPFTDNEALVIAGRVEERDSEHSDICFFVEKNNKWAVRENSPTFKLQDPFFTFIKDELIFGGVEVFPHPQKKDALGWRTVFYRGKTINELEKFAQGPDGMKDIRLVELSSGEIGVFTRPQGDVGGRGKIGYTTIQNLADLNEQAIENATLLSGQFVDEEWGGANEIHLLKNNLLGVIGHIACFDSNGDRHYYPMAFAFNPEDRSYSDIELLATRSDFLEGPSKRPDLMDVVFSGGLLREKNEEAILYTGISDAEAQKIRIPDPFVKFEK